MCGTPLFNWGTQQTCRIYIIMFSELQNEVGSFPDNQFYSKTVVEGGVMTFVLQQMWRNYVKKLQKLC